MLGSDLQEVLVQVLADHQVVVECEKLGILFLLCPLVRLDGVMALLPSEFGLDSFISSTRTFIHEFQLGALLDEPQKLHQGRELPHFLPELFALLP